MGGNRVCCYARFGMKIQGAWGELPAWGDAPRGGSRSDLTGSCPASPASLCARTSGEACVTEMVCMAAVRGRTG